MKEKFHWTVEPSNLPDFDYACLPGDTEEDHRAALEFAKERLEEAWDSLEVGESKTVTIARVAGPMPDDCEEL